VRLSFHVRRAHRHGYVRFCGTVAPAEVGAQVGFQLLRRLSRSMRVGRSANLARRAWGTSALSCACATVLLCRALIKVSDGAHVSNYSEPILVR
jgi:hypothetical protein